MIATLRQVASLLARAPLSAQAALFHIASIELHEELAG